MKLPMGNEMTEEKTVSYLNEDKSLTGDNKSLLTNCNVSNNEKLISLMAKERRYSKIICKI